MYKLLGLEGLSKSAFEKWVIYPKFYKFWWNKLLHKLIKLAIKAQYY